MVCVHVCVCVCVCVCVFVSLANAAPRGTSEGAVSDGHYRVQVSALRSGDGRAEGGRDIGEEASVAWRKWV